MGCQAGRAGTAQQAPKQRMSSPRQGSADHRPVYLYPGRGAGGGARRMAVRAGVDDRCTGPAASRAVEHGRAAAGGDQLGRPDADPRWRDHHAALHERADLTDAGITPAGRRNGQATGHPGDRAGGDRAASRSTRCRGWLIQLRGCRPYRRRKRGGSPDRRQGARTARRRGRRAGCGCGGRGPAGGSKVAGESAERCSRPDSRRPGYGRHAGNGWTRTCARRSGLACRDGRLLGRGGLLRCDGIAGSGRRVSSRARLVCCSGLVSGCERSACRSRLVPAGSRLLRLRRHILRPDGAADLPADRRVDHALAPLGGRAGPGGEGAAGRHLPVDRTQCHRQGGGFTARRPGHDRAQDSSRVGDRCPGQGRRCVGGQVVGRCSPWGSRRAARCCQQLAGRRVRWRLPGRGARTGPGGGRTAPGGGRAGSAEGARAAGSRAAGSAGGRRAAGSLAAGSRAARSGSAPVDTLPRHDRSRGAGAGRSGPRRSGRWRHGAPGNSGRRRQLCDGSRRSQSKTRLRAGRRAGTGPERLRGRRPGRRWGCRLVRGCRPG